MPAEVKTMRETNIAKKRWKLKRKEEGTYNRGDRTAQSKRYRETRAEAVQAQKIAERARKNGTLIKPDSCSVCNLSTDDLHGHHEDYGKPLKVIWVCWLCHNNLHKFKG